VTANKSVTANFAADASVGVQTTSLVLTDDAWYDANLGASGPWAEYRIYANGVLIGTKPANGVSTWDCPQTVVPAGARIDIVRDCGFSSLEYYWDRNVPLTSSFTLPAGANRLEAATWGGFMDMESNDAYYDPYGSDYTYSFIGSSTITNIKYSTTGTITFSPNAPGDLEYWNWEVRTSGGALVASGNSATPVARVPVSPDAYTVKIDYRNYYYNDPTSESFPALVDSAGKNVNIGFNL